MSHPLSIGSSGTFGRTPMPATLEVLRGVPIDKAIRRSLMALAMLGRMTSRAGAAIGKARLLWATGGKLPQGRD